MSAVLARTSFHLTPLAVAITAALHHAPASAAAVDWLPDADGFRDVATNWSSNPGMPGAADDVTLSVGGVVVRTITHRTGTNAINSLTSQENFALTGGALEIDEVSTIGGTYTQNGGTLSGAGTLTLSGSGLWSGGEMTGTGTTRVADELAIEGTYFSPTYLTGGRTLENAGTVTWRLGSEGYGSYIVPGEGARNRQRRDMGGRDRRGLQYDERDLRCLR